MWIITRARECVSAIADPKIKKPKIIQFQEATNFLITSVKTNLYYADMFAASKVFRQDSGLDRYYCVSYYLINEMLHI